MGLPLIKRLSLDENGFPVLEKHLIQKLAIRYLPNDIVYRKKAFVVSFERDQRTEALFDSFPKHVLAFPCSSRTNDSAEKS